MRYFVMCKVWGGVTGTRQAPLKHDGNVLYFATKEEAQAVADQQNRDVAKRRETYRERFPHLPAPAAQYEYTVASL